MFEGRGPLVILLLVLRRRPRAQPHAVRAADDSDQPRHHRRRRAGRRAPRGARLPARLRLRRRDGVVYGVLGLVVILTAGTFGTINASPWFNLGIAVLFVVLGLAMFDVLADRLLAVLEPLRPGARTRQRSSLAFSMGAVAALLAGACVAPVVIQVVLFSSNLYATGTTIALALPFCPRHRHGDSVADCRRRPRGAAEARHVDGAREAGVRRPDSRDRRVLRLRGVLDLRRIAGSTPPTSRRASRNS